ncbi:hypothetical protein [Parasitella parasitica]|uniref:Uncharacterized protein n=1 Tax=Parasitella parasitica TaxID=35722 RepID=A0A0B7MWE4_9FUNG|nr:hypothetical protein [Parasitella parasitica]
MKKIYKNESIKTEQGPEIQRQQVENTTNDSNVVNIDDDKSVEDVSQDVSDPESDCDVDLKMLKTFTAILVSLVLSMNQD